MNMNNVIQAGVIAILKTESMITNFLNSIHVKNYLTYPRFIDYYNLILTNPYRSTSDFISSFPYNQFDVDTKLIENSIRIEEGKNLCNLFASLRIRES
jgi:hypothetical protein